LCFSAEADLVAGVVVSGAGIDALRHVGRRRDLLLAALPLVFGVHQLIETFTWWQLQGKIPEPIGTIAMWVYLVIAFGVVPVLVPAAVASAETVSSRRRWMIPLVAVGAVVAGILLLRLLFSPPHAEIACRYIQYHTKVAYGGQIAVLYMAATCGPLLLSSSKRIAAFGAVNLLMAVLLGWLLASGVISLWCGWAAATSFLVVVRFRRSDQAQEEVAAFPAPA
jgi:hypothetical protein